MGILEGIIYTLWRGLAIGFIISAPMGPVGILCVQRTLDKGRKTGLYTGVGAALSDILYCLLTGFGLSFIEEFLERNSNVIQLIGSVVLIGFGFYLFRANPSRKLKKPTDNRIPAGKNILNGFLFTFSNPLIIFLIIGLFARFNFLMPEIKFYHYIIGFLAIFAGALLWWYVVTYFVDKVRAHFNLRSMWLINKIIGSLIFIFAVVGIITAVSGLASASRRTTYMNRERGYSDFHSATDTTLIIKNDFCEPLTDLIAVHPTGESEWKLRVVNSHNRRGESYRYVSLDGKVHKVKHPGWGFILKGPGGDTSIRFRTKDENDDETYSSPCIVAIVEAGGKELSRKTLYSGFDLYGGANSFRLRFSGEAWMLEGGNRQYTEIARGEVPENKLDSVGFIVNPGGEIKVENISITDSPLNSNHSQREITELLKKVSQSADPLIGEWGVFDMKLDSNLLKMGGNYRLVIAGSDNGYEIIYLGGGVVNGNKWEPGMIKGYIYTTPFDKIYEIEWIGTSGNTLEGIKAQLEDDVLTLQFPQHDSDLRLRKITSRP
ncbi:MAG: LysE family translocator [Muribaculaceae bacterium]|nr:LysE family translocator [Muribaculaceae bacterium]